jgi:hypothetical protein
MSACHAPGCVVDVPHGRLMCREHWYALPRPLRTAINQTWRARQMSAYVVNVQQAQELLRSDG